MATVGTTSCTFALFLLAQSPDMAFSTSFNGSQGEESDKVRFRLRVNKDGSTAVSVIQCRGAPACTTACPAFTSPN